MQINRFLGIVLKCCIFIISYAPFVYGQKMTLEEVVNVMENTNKCGTVFRVPTNNVKLEYFNGLLKSGDLTENKETSIKSSIADTEAENADYLNIVRQGFDQYYKFSTVYYVPDTIYKRMLNAKEFIYYDYELHKVMSAPGVCKPTLAILPGTDKDELALHYLDGRKVDRPLPYQKKTFMSAYKKLFKRKTYLQDQIKWFNEQFHLIYAFD